MQVGQHGVCVLEPLPGLVRGEALCKKMLRLMCVDVLKQIISLFFFFLLLLQAIEEGALDSIDNTDFLGTDIPFEVFFIFLK